MRVFWQILFKNKYSIVPHAGCSHTINILFSQKVILFFAYIDYTGVVAELLLYLDGFRIT